MTSTHISPEQAASSMDRIMAASKLYDRYLEIAGVADVASFQAANAVTELAAPRPVPLTLTFARR